MKTASLVLPALLLAACATAPAAPAKLQPAPFQIERDLAGKTVARGEFRSITGVRRGFTAELTGTPDGDVFTLAETFAFDDGARDQKTWVLTRTRPGQYDAVREDVIGTGKGFQDGDVFRLEYDVRLPSEKGEGRIVRFRDVLYLNAGGIGNDATVGWRGLRVATVKLQIERN